MTVKGHMRRLPMKRYHKSLVFHHPYPLALQCKLEFLFHPVIASIGHIGGLRHTHTHTHKVKFAMLSASEARSLECQVKWAPTLDCSPRLSSAFCSALAFAQPNPPWPLLVQYCLSNVQKKNGMHKQDEASFCGNCQNKTICMVLKSYYVQRCKQWGCWATPQLISSFLCFCRFFMVDDHWSCTVIDEIVSKDRPSEYYLLSNRVILSLSNAQAPSIVRPTTRRHRGSVADICLLRQESPRWTLCDFVFVVRTLQIVSEADIWLNIYLLSLFQLSA